MLVGTCTATVLVKCCIDGLRSCKQSKRVAFMTCILLTKRKQCPALIQLSLQS